MILPTEIDVATALWVAPAHVDTQPLLAVLAEQGVSVLEFPTGLEAMLALDEPDMPVPHVAFVDPTLPGVRAFLISMRAQPHLSHIPVVYISPSMTAEVIRRAHTFGADDVLWTGDSEWLQKLCVQIRSFNPGERPAADSGRVLILHPSEERRRLLGRVYRNAGFDVMFGTSKDELQLAYDPSPGFRLVVACSGFFPGGVSEVCDAREKSSNPALPWILVDNSAEHAVVGGDGLRGVASLAADGPLDNVLFLTNELLAPERPGMRRSRRYLLNGLCSFRRSDELRYHSATLYNISRDGLYVRTLIPLVKGERVRLELTPPGQDEPVHLFGHVAWARGVAEGGQLSPAGFGVQLLVEHCSAADVRAYVEGYDTLVNEHRDGVVRPLVPGTSDTLVGRPSIQDGVRNAN